MRERERIEEASFSLPFTSFCRSKLDRPEVKVALRDESSTCVLESQDFAKAQGLGFSRNREKAVSREITLFEIGFFFLLGLISV